MKLYTIHIPSFLPISNYLHLHLQNKFSQHLLTYHLPLQKMLSVPSCFMEFILIPCINKTNNSVKKARENRNSQQANMHYCHGHSISHYGCKSGLLFAEGTLLYCTSVLIFKLLLRNIWNYIRNHSWFIFFIC